MLYFVVRPRVGYMDAPQEDYAVLGGGEGFVSLERSEDSEAIGYGVTVQS